MVGHGRRPPLSIGYFGSKPMILMVTKWFPGSVRDGYIVSRSYGVGPEAQLSLLNRYFGVPLTIGRTGGSPHPPISNSISPSYIILTNLQHVIMDFILLFSALVALLSNACLAATGSDPAPDLLPACDTHCLQRVVYQTTYAAGSSTIGQALAAYNSSAWCTDERNVDWCPATINSTLSTIASAAVSDIDFSAAPVSYSTSPGSEVQSDNPSAFWLASELAKASDKAEMMAWSFASGTLDRKFAGNGTSVPLDRNDAAVLLIAEIVYNISTAINATGNGSSIDKAAFQQALIQPRPAPNSTSLAPPKKHQDNHLAGILGTTIPVGLIGSIIGLTACADPVLCGGKTASFLAKIFHGLTGKNVWEITKDGPRLINDKGVDGLDKLMEWIDKAKEPKTKSETSSKLDSFKPWKKFTEEVDKDSLRKTLTGKTWENIPGENGEPLVAPPKKPLPGDVVRNEWYEPETRTMKQEFLKPAGEDAISKVPKVLRDLGYKPYWKVNDEGDIVGKKLMFHLPDTLKSVPTTPEGIAPGTSLVLTDAAKDAVFDSAGNPIISTAGAAGAMPALLSLVPIAPPAAGEAGSSNWYTFVDDSGKALVGFDNTERCLRFGKTKEPAKIGKTLHQTTEGELRGHPKPQIKPTNPALGTPLPPTTLQPTYAPTSHQPAPPQYTPRPDNEGKNGDDHGIDPDWDHDVDIGHDWDHDLGHDGDDDTDEPGETVSARQTAQPPAKTKSPKASKTSASTLSTSTKKSKTSSSLSSVTVGKPTESSSSTSASTSTSPNPALATPTNGKPCACSSAYSRKQKDDHFWKWDPPAYCKHWKDVVDPLECSKGKKPCQCTAAYKEWKRDKKGEKGWKAPVACALWGGVEDPDGCKKGHWFTGGADWWDKGAEWPWAKKGD